MRGDKRSLQVPATIAPECFWLKPPIQSLLASICLNRVICRLSLLEQQGVESIITQMKAATKRDGSRYWTS